MGTGLMIANPHDKYDCDLKRKEILTQITTWMKLEDTDIKGQKYCMIRLIQVTLRGQIHRQKGTWWLPGAGRRRSVTIV